MRRAAKVDRNHSDIVSALRGIGAQVVTLHAVGGGIPDILVYFKRTFLLEIKDGQKPPSARKLTEDQIVFHAWWGGELHVVSSIKEAIEAAYVYNQGDI